MTHRKYHHGDLKSALIQAAQELLIRKGIEALSLRALASEVGVSHMAPYAHFKNKTELFQAIAASGFDALSKRMESVDLDQSPLNLILDYGTQYIEFAVSNAPLYRLMLSQTQVTGPKQPKNNGSHMTEELTMASMRPFKLLVSAFSGMADENYLQSIQAQGAWAVVHGIASLLIDGHLFIPEHMTTRQYLAAATLHTGSNFNEKGPK